MHPFKGPCGRIPTSKLTTSWSTLESDAFAADAVSLALADYIGQKYRGRRIDVVIAIADPALRFVLDYRDELFPDVPIVYSGVAVLEDNRRGAARGLTAVLRGVAYAETLKAGAGAAPINGAGVRGRRQCGSPGRQLGESRVPRLLNGYDSRFSMRQQCLA